MPQLKFLTDCKWFGLVFDKVNYFDTFIVGVKPMFLIRMYACVWLCTG